MSGAGDQALLLQVRRSVLPQLQLAGTALPIDFNVQQGVVTITGTAPNTVEKQRILTLVRQVPGVVQVSDQVKLAQ